jgi:hypothetical protein
MVRKRKDTKSKPRMLTNKRFVLSAPTNRTALRIVQQRKKSPSARCAAPPRKLVMFIPGMNTRPRAARNPP